VARTAAELGLGELLPLDEAIPELRPARQIQPVSHLSRREQELVPTEGFEPS
jgi:hypothetical protein